MLMVTAVTFAARTSHYGPPSVTFAGISRFLEHLHTLCVPHSPAELGCCVATAQNHHPLPAANFCLPAVASTKTKSDKAARQRLRCPCPCPYETASPPSNKEGCGSYLLQVRLQLALLTAVFWEVFQIYNFKHASIAMFPIQNSGNMPKMVDKKFTHHHSENGKRS